MMEVKRLQNVITVEEEAEDIDAGVVEGAVLAMVEADSTALANASLNVTVAMISRE